MNYHMRYNCDLECARQKGSGNDRTWVMMDETTLNYVRLQTAINLFDYFRQLDAKYIPPMGELRTLCDGVYDLLGQWLEQECPQALKDPDLLPERQRRRYRTTLPLA